MPVNTSINWHNQMTTQMQSVLKKIELLDINAPDINDNVYTNKTLYLISKINNILQTHEIQWSDVSGNKIYFDLENNIYYLDGREFPDYITNILLQKTVDKTISGIVMEKMQLEISTKTLSLRNIHKRYSTQIQQLLKNNNYESLQTTRMDHNPDNRMLYAILVANELHLTQKQLLNLLTESLLYADILSTYRKITKIQIKPTKFVSVADTIEFIKNLHATVEKIITFISTDTCNWYYYMRLLQIHNTKSETYNNDYNLETNYHGNIHSGNFTILTNSSCLVVPTKHTTIDTTTMILQLNDPHGNANGYFSNFLLGYNIYNKIDTVIYGMNTINGFTSCIEIIKNNFTLLNHDQKRFWQLCETLEFGIGTQLHDSCVLLFKTNVIKKILNEILEKKIKYVTSTDLYISNAIKLNQDYFARYNTIVNNFNNIETKLSAVTNNTYGTIITKEFLQKYNCVVTGGAICCLISDVNFTTDDIDILTPQENYAVVFAQLSKHINVDTTFTNEKNVLNRRHLFKLKSGFYIDLFCSNLSDVGYMSTIQRFHVSCVRAYWNGINLVALPSYVHCMLSNNIEKSRYISTTQSVVSIYKKYHARGFNVAFTDKYCHYFFENTL